jgi:hypothetical protein
MQYLSPLSGVFAQSDDKDYNNVSILFDGEAEEWDLYELP